MAELQLDTGIFLYTPDPTEDGLYLAHSNTPNPTGDEIIVSEVYGTEKIVSGARFRLHEPSSNRVRMITALRQRNAELAITQTISLAPDPESRIRAGLVPMRDANEEHIFRNGRYRWVRWKYRKYRFFWNSLKIQETDVDLIDEDYYDDETTAPLIDLSELENPIAADREEIDDPTDTGERDPRPMRTRVKEFREKRQIEFELSRIKGRARRLKQVELETKQKAIRAEIKRLLTERKEKKAARIKTNTELLREAKKQQLAELQDENSELRQNIRARLLDRPDRPDRR